MQPHTVDLGVGGGNQMMWSHHCGHITGAYPEMVESMPTIRDALNSEFKSLLAAKIA
jgi:hypothetical protein